MLFCLFGQRTSRLWKITEPWWTRQRLLRFMFYLVDLTNPLESLTLEITDHKFAGNIRHRFSEVTGSFPEPCV